MVRLILRRAGRAALTVAAVVVFVFVGARLTGNPFLVIFPEGITNEDLAALNAQFGLDRSFAEQFALYLAGVARGDFGISIAERRPVVEIFAECVPRTMVLGAWTLALSVSAGLLVGIYAAARPRSLGSRILMSALGAGYAIPGFVIAVFLILIFSFHLKILPSIAGDSPLSLVMPIIALSAHPIASIARYVRSSFLDVINQDFIRTARSKGIGRIRVLRDHALRNALIPVATVIGILVTDIVSGSIIIETVFSWPGVGKRLVGAVLERDFPVLQFGVVCFSVVVIATNLLVDVLYAYLDPRIRVES
jgi:ABC-type dipeptide/oligopeptide/nickel transport system permease component